MTSSILSIIFLMALMAGALLFVYDPNSRSTGRVFIPETAKLSLLK